MAIRDHWIASGILGFAVLAAAAVPVATRRWDRRTAELVSEIIHAQSATTVERDVLPGLPDPVRRYFRSALPDNQRPIRVARITTAGTFRQVATKGDRDATWMPFTARQTFTTEPPAFVWAATMRMLPLLSVYVRDGYVQGRGSMQGSALGLFSVVDAHDEPELNAGALMRYLAEAAWFPTALLPNERLTWTAIDDTHARATLKDGQASVSVTFEFDRTGDILGVRADRHRATDRGYEMTPWSGQFWQHELRDGMRIPLSAEVSWELGGETLPYWRGQVVDATYDVLPVPTAGLHDD